MDSSPEEPMVPRNGDTQWKGGKGKGNEGKGKEKGKERYRGRSPIEKQNQKKETGQTRP
jgi:hypothetical protein